jgi:serine/threonine protein kinase
MLAPGQLLQNRYRVLHSIGKGGFGQVFEVEEDGTRKVLKVLNLRTFSPSQHPKVIALFRREAEVLSQFYHPGVPQIDRCTVW